MNIADQLKATWKNANEGLSRLPPDLRSRVKRNMRIAGACTVVSGCLLVGSLRASPLDIRTAAINTGILAGVGYYATRTTRLLTSMPR